MRSCLIFQSSKARRIFCRICIGLALLFLLNKLCGRSQTDNTQSTQLVDPLDGVHARLCRQGLKLGSPAPKAAIPNRQNRSLWEEVKENRNRGMESLPWLVARPLEELIGNVVPNSVHFVWCQNRTFTFKDYLSVWSAWKLLEPDIIEVHVNGEIGTDKYNSWLSELRDSVPPLVFSEAAKTSGLASQRCDLRHAVEILSDRGGIFVSFSTVLTRSLHGLRKSNFSVGADSDGDVSFVLSQQHFRPLDELLTKRKLSATSLLRMSSDGPLHCAAASTSLPLTIEDSADDAVCVTFPASLDLKPLDLLNTECNSSGILRAIVWQGFQSEERQKKACPIPNIVHYVWFNRANLSFRMYLSFLSTLYIAKPERIFVHTDAYLSGPYWQKIASHANVSVVHREAPRQIYGRVILYSQHRSDVVRADVLDKFGGVYLDWDVLWLRSPGQLRSAGHEAVVDFDHMPRPPFPDVINLGVALARPRSSFVRHWRQGLRQYRSEDFFYNALELPYKVYEKHPESVYIEKRLQVMCFWLKCHPIFHKDHKDWNNAQAFDWRTDAYAIHFTHPDPDEYDSLDKLRNSSGLFADIGKYILDQAGEQDFLT